MLPNWKIFSFKVLYHEKNCATQYWRDEREFYLPGITRETPGKHPGKVHLLTFWVKEASFRIKTSLTKVVGIIFSKSKSVQKKCSGTPGKHPGNTQEMPGKHQGKVHLLKVSWFQNVLWVPSFRPKNQRNFFKNFGPRGQIKKIKALYYTN